MKLALLLSVAALAVAQLIPGQYIVVLRDGHSASDVADVVKTYGLTADRTYTSALTGFAGAVPDAVLPRLRADLRVLMVEQDQMMHATPLAIRPHANHGKNASKGAKLENACTTQRTNVDWGLARICHSGAITSGIGNIYSYDTTAGTTVDVYIVDTGIFSTHVDFTGRASQVFKATPSWGDTDGNGHGTHVASTVGGATWGVAKLVDRIYGVKVLDDSGSGTNAGVINGVDFVTAIVRGNRTKKIVVNLSLGGGASATLDAAINTLNDAGAFVAVAAGNDNGDACNSSPARAVNAFTVGSTTISSAGDVRSSFSNFGTCVNIFAPGSDIQAAWIGSTTATRTISGTSMASPHICGAGALLFGTGAETVNEVKSLMQSFSTRGVIDLRCTTTACNNSPNTLVYTGCDCS